MTITEVEIQARHLPADNLTFVVFEFTPPDGGAKLQCYLTPESACKMADQLFNAAKDADDFKRAGR